MAETAATARQTAVSRAARIAFTFLVMNCAAVAGLIAFLLGKDVWRRHS
jgi:hypothetical protein